MFISLLAAPDYQYFIDGISLHSVNQVLDLGIILLADLFFYAHIDIIYGKNLRVLVSLNVPAMTLTILCT